MVRVLTTVASVAGSLMIIGAFPFYAAKALPYQDAAPELLRFQQEREVQLGLVMLLGLAITIAGSFYLWRSWRRGER